MELKFEKLIKFDLIQKLEESIFKKGKPDELADFFSTVLEIQSIDRFIKDSPSFPGSTDKIIRDELISAIGATLSIEGTVLGSEEIKESFEKANLNETLRRKEQEAENSRKVYQFIIELVRGNKGEFQYRESMIKQIHLYFTENMRYLGNRPGDYRGDFPATFGVPRREGLCKTRSDVEIAMSNFVHWLNERGSGFFSRDIFVKAIMAHYYLTEIHPFADGNGRTARALEALVLYVNGVNNYCFWSLANFWSMYRAEYIYHLGNIRNTCNPWDYVIWGMKGYLDEVKRIRALVLKKVKQLMLMDYAKYLLETKRKQEIKLNQRIVDVLRLLIRSGKVPFDQFRTSPEVQALHKGVVATTRHRDFKKMTKSGLVKLSTENDKLYIEPNFQIFEYVSYYV